MYSHVSLRQVADRLNWADWDSIKQEAARQAGFLLPLQDEILIWHRQFPNHTLNWGLRNFAHADFFVCKGQRKSSLSLQIDTRENLYFFDDTVKYSLSKIAAYFTCPDCGEVFKFNCAPKSFSKELPFCRKCQQQVLFRCKSYREHHEKSLLENYGVRKPLQSDVILQRAKDTMMSRYGVAHSALNPVSIAKREETCLARYGRKNYWSNINPWKEFDLYGHVTSKRRTSSKIEADFIETISREVFSNFSIRHAGNRQKRWKRQSKHANENSVFGFLDCYVEELNLGIEFHGDFFHLNPRLYNADYFTSWGYTAQEKWDRDKVRINDVRDCITGIEVHIVWEYDWKNSQETVLEKLRQLRDERQSINIHTA